MHLKRFVCDKDGKVVLWQKPNVPAYAVVVGLLLGYVPALSAYLLWIQLFTLSSLFVWGILELLQGCTPLRRVFGMIALAIVLYSALLLLTSR